MEREGYDGPWDISAELIYGMSKSHVTELSEVFACVFKDAARAFPTLGNEFSKDFSTLHSLSKQRGIHVFLVDLPAVGKHLDRCLNDGHFQPCGLPLTKRYTRGVVIPKFLRGLYQMVFEETGCLKDTYSIEAVFFLRQILYLAKKAVVDCSQDRIENEVLEFYQTDNSLPEPHRFWGESADPSDDVWRIYHGYGRDPACTSRMSAELAASNSARSRCPLSVLDFVSTTLVSTLGSYDPGEWKFRHGPGAVSETTSAACKYEYLRESWTPCLDSEYPFADYGFHNYSSWGNWLLTSREFLDEHVRGDEYGRGVFRTEYAPQTEISPSGRCRPSSRMVAVPKSFSRPRLIAAEPTAHQFCQQNLWHYFRVRTERSWISKFIRFTDQRENQRLCVKGSKDNTLATVDLSAASDRVTCDTVGNFFRSNPKLLKALRVTRTHFVDQTITSKVPRRIQLRKFSTMGNACTFPVESLIFLGLALTSVLVARNLPLRRKSIIGLIGEVAVFGDDIIVPSDSREHFERLLEVMHFKINAAKTYWTGRFRESCGVDSLSGVEVTPAYWRGAFHGQVGSLAMAVETSNNFYKKFLLETSSHIASTLPGQIALVQTGFGAFGLQTRTRPDNRHLKCRFNLDLMRVEYLCEQVLTSSERTQTESDSALLQYFTEAPPPHQKWKAGYNQRPRLRKKRRWVCASTLHAQEETEHRELVRLRLNASRSSGTTTYPVVSNSLADGL